MQQHDKARAAWKKALELYDTSSRRKKDDRFQEIQNKLQLLAGAVAGSPRTLCVTSHACGFAFAGGGDRSYHRACERETAKRQA